MITESSVHTRHDGWTRRQFLLHAALTGAAVTFVPGVLAAEQRPRVGIVGLGSRGMVLAAWCARTPGLELSSLCDLWPPALAAAARFAADGAKSATDFRCLLDDPGLDALLLAVPSPNLERIAERAVAVGKNVLLIPPIPVEVLSETLCRATSKRRGLVAILPRVRYTKPEPWLDLPRVARLWAGTLRVVLPRPNEPVTVERALYETLDDFDFLRSLLGAEKLVAISAVAAAAPGRILDLRANLRLSTEEGAPAFLDLHVAVSSSPSTPRRSQILVGTADRQARLHGESLRWDVTRPNPEIALLAAAIRNERRDLLTLPGTSAVASTWLLADVARELRGAIYHTRI